MIKKIVLAFVICSQAFAVNPGSITKKSFGLVQKSSSSKKRRTTEASSSDKSTWVDIFNNNECKVALSTNGRIKINLRGHSVNMSINEVDGLGVSLNEADLRLMKRETSLHWRCLLSEVEPECVAGLDTSMCSDHFLGAIR